MLNLKHVQAVHQHLVNTAIALKTTTHRELTSVIELTPLEEGALYGPEGDPVNQALDYLAKWYMDKQLPALTVLVARGTGGSEGMTPRAFWYSINREYVLTTYLKEVVQVLADELRNDVYDYYRDFTYASVKNLAVLDNRLSAVRKLESPLVNKKLVEEMGRIQTKYADTKENTRLFQVSIFDTLHRFCAGEIGELLEYLDLEYEYTNDNARVLRNKIRPQQFDVRVSIPLVDGRNNVNLAEAAVKSVLGHSYEGKAYLDLKSFELENIVDENFNSVPFEASPNGYVLKHGMLHIDKNHSLIFVESTSPKIKALVFHVNVNVLHQ